MGHDVEAQCICSDPYTGLDCSQVMCSHSAITCYNGGECTDGQSCTCPPGYGGVNCRGCKLIWYPVDVCAIFFFSSAMWIWILLQWWRLYYG